VIGRLGLRYSVAGWDFQFGGGAGLVPGVGAPSMEWSTRVTYAPWGEDQDGDGIPDDQDLCPKESEDRDGYQDTDGCPDLDNDQDGIPDDQDLCPIKPEDKDGFEDQDGCPDLDNDRDGFLDKEDKCPNEPETINGIDDDDGCPEPDRDRDGILDKDDKCPDQPEDKDGFEDQDGCSDLDNDGDGILDNLDRCPNEPENKNGFEDDDGCPDSPKPQVKFGKHTIWTSQAIYFDPGKWYIKARFRPMLKKLSVAIAANKKIHVVYVEGHTDEKGDDTYNQWLSFYRAEEVLLLMRKMGAPRTKLRAMGRGADQPADSNTTTDGMARNRRVIFHVEYKTPKPPKKKKAVGKFAIPTKGEKEKIIAPQPLPPPVEPPEPINPEDRAIKSLEKKLDELEGRKPGQPATNSISPNPDASVSKPRSKGQ
jgi:outer membrane protein OmpA-like peptidoglycan-associated protein